MQQTLIKTFGKLALVALFVSSAYGAPTWVQATDKVCVDNGGEIKEKICYSKWEEAKKICSASEAQLPTMDELRGVVLGCTGKLNERGPNQNNVHYSKCYPKKGFTPYAYWSNEINAENRVEIHTIGFFYGSEYKDNKNHYNYIHCVASTKK